MILFYSQFCQHCTVLIDTIKKHDSNGMIKMVSIDTLRSLQKPIDPKIESVPALLKNVETREYIFGKAVFDFLLLPNRGILFTNSTTRNDKSSKDAKDVSSLNMMTKNEIVANTEPVAFTLGNILSENFSPIDDKNIGLMNDRNYNWDIIDDGVGVDKNETKEIKSDSSINENKKLPSMEEILKKREIDLGNST